MIYCFDTYYFDDKAQTACIGIQKWEQAVPDFQLTETISGIQAYESGSFYKRELPCLQSILKQISLATDDILVIDGFVVLDDDEKLGLGGYLYEYLNENIPVIGVAKNNFATLENAKREIYRGESKRPLYITTKGINIDTATSHIAQMHGEFRMPTILKLVDTLCREID